MKQKLEQVNRINVVDANGIVRPMTPKLAKQLAINGDRGLPIAPKPEQAVRQRKPL